MKYDPKMPMRLPPIQTELSICGLNIQKCYVMYHLQHPFLKYILLTDSIRKAFYSIILLYKITNVNRKIKIFQKRLVDIKYIYCVGWTEGIFSYGGFSGTVQACVCRDTTCRVRGHRAPGRRRNQILRDGHGERSIWACIFRRNRIQ